MSELPQTIQAILTFSKVDAKTVEQNPRSTIVPISLRAATPGSVSVDTQLEILETIGEGGMGVVMRGVQGSVEREVAVKALKPAHKNQHSAFKLLREARVTGALEHPNVIPVYDVAQESDGSPLIVLKKVEGVVWSQLMHDAEAVRERFRADDLLEWNLGVLMQVTNAVSFAHSRGVLHRDLKPDNVMIGSFGEVYVVDWGIAVGLGETSGRLPLASESFEMAGTPVYMAPEMLGGPVSRLSERSDVYLLASILYQIVVGEPPHVGVSMNEIMQSILASQPDVPDEVPAQLARILRRALDANPDARYERAEHFRQAIEGFLRHRSAEELARDARERLSALIERLADAADDELPIYRLYGECRFGLRHALEVWPDNDELRRSLQVATVAMVEHELRANDPRAARVLLRDLDAVPPELAERVSAAQARYDAEYGELRRLREDLDPRRGGKLRGVLLILLATIWVLWPLLVEFPRATGHRSFTPSVATLMSAGVFAIVLAIVVWDRETLLASAINRRLGFAGVLASLIELVWAAMAWVMGASLVHGLHERMMSAAALAAMLAASVDWRLLVGAGGYLAGYVIVGLVGVESVLYATSAANLILFVNLAVVLSGRRRSSDRAHDDA